MGKPFNTELQVLSKTYEFSREIDMCTFEQYIFNHISSPFLVVGSGGSLAVAQTCALVINYLGGFAQVVTPYELMGFSRSIHKDNVVFFSAGGGNSDIINAYDFCKRMEANSSFIICLSESSKLIELAENKYNDQSYIELSLPNGHDGFLAVNSTVCAVMMLKKLIVPTDPTPFIMPVLSEDAIKCLFTDSIIALGGRWTTPVVSDFESKCTEAGLIKVLPADLRNFAHGRHHWIAKNPNTSVICFVTKDEYELAKKTIGILPKTVSSCILLTNQDGISATLDLLFYVFLLVQRLGELKGIDPGKPGVPRFGSQLYRVNYRLSAEAEASGALNSSIIKRMAKRKAFVTYNKDLVTIENAAKEYLEKLSRAYFSGIVLDYDNTVIANNNTDDDTYRSCMNSICSFLEKGIKVCFATGRGKSIREQLLQFIPSDFATSTYIAYYPEAILPVFESQTEELIRKNSLLASSRELIIEIIKTKSLFLALSDGARIDIFRRTAGLEHDQVCVDYAISTKKCNEIIEKMNSRVNTKDAGGKIAGILPNKLEHIFLLDDFSASGVSYLRKEGKKWDGKIFKAISNLENRRVLEANNNVKIHIILYLATDKAINRLRNNIADFCGDNDYEIDICCIQKVSPVELSPQEDDLFEKHYLNNKKSIEDSHYKKGDMTYPHYGFDGCGLALVIHHNTPNNSFPIIWAGKNALFPRVTRHKDVR